MTFEDIDVNIPVERKTAAGPFPHPPVIRRASTKSPQAIFAEIEAARREPVVADDQWTTRMMRALLRQRDSAVTCVGHNSVGQLARMPSTYMATPTRIRTE